MMTEHHFVPGAIIFNEGDTGDAMYIIRAGRVVVVKGGFKSPTILGYRGVGETIGEMALLENRPRSAAVVAIEELSLLRISREDFQALRDSNPSFELSMAQALSARLRAANEVRSEVLLAKKSLSRQISRLQTENEQLLELQRLRQDTSDFIVHDLRSPLSLVAGAISMLEMVLPEEVVQANREILELADVNCKRMQRMVDSLLDIARMEAGETALRLAQVNLADPIKRAINRLNTALKSRNLTLSAILPAGLPTLTVDEEQIDRVLENLIDNAIKYSPTGGRITIAAELKGEEVLVSIANTGPTIPAADREHIFERFAQASSPGFRTRGSGLGLAFCRLAVAAHGGRIWVEPGEGDEGNNFVFSLPLSKPSPNEC
jgi:signal transduction histidine kinase